MPSVSFVITLTVSVPATTAREDIERRLADFLEACDPWTGRVVAVEEFHDWTTARGSQAGYADVEQGDQRAS